MPSLLTATLADRKRACELGAAFIENDLRQLRTDVRRLADRAEEYGDHDPAKGIPVGTSHEGDVMKAMEWASAVTWLRAMAREDA